MRTFVTIRQFALNYSELQSRINEIESELPEIYNVLNYLVDKDKTIEENTNRTQIGYKKYKFTKMSSPDCSENPFVFSFKKQKIVTKSRK